MVRSSRLAAALFTLAALGCGKGSSSSSASDAAGKPTVAPDTLPSAAADAARVVTRPGMAWVPAGTLLAGTPRTKTPRVADEEMSAVPVELGGFYIDLLPWPNEPNAIPTSNVSRDEAEQLCASKGKRLCSELEWERACKGPDNTTYEYGDAYRAVACGTGVALEQASRRPTGEHAQCKSGFGVMEMHGGVWEWTSSAWGRGSKDAAQGVLRGGNSPAGELVGRCANAIARSETKKSPTMGFRCCAGTRNVAEVKLDVTGTPGLVLGPPRLATPWLAAVVGAANVNDIEPKSAHAWTWTPVGNEELLVITGCSSAPKACGLVVVRPSLDDAGAPAAPPLVSVATGRDTAEVTRAGDARHLRIRSLDARGIFSRELTYLYGRVELGEPKRP